MTSIKLTVTGAQIWASVTGVLTSGMVGIPITIEYDEAWDGLTKNLMCRCSPWGSDDGEIRTRLNVGEASTVAHEVMQQGMYLYLGVEGFRADGTLVIPTTWARCGKIEYGANTCDDPSIDPELTIWNQLQTEMEETKKYVLTPEQAVNIQAYAQEARQAAEEAKQAAKYGLYYIPTISQPTDRTLRFAFTPSITGAPTPNPVTVVLPDDEDSGENAGCIIPVDFSGVTAHSVNHRGYSATAPENTIPAYILSKEKGFTCVEADVAFTADGVAVLLHDSTIDRTSNGSGSISALTYAEVSKYDFGSWKGEEYAGTRIPTFAEFIAFCKNVGLHPYIELKNAATYTAAQIQSLVTTVNKCGMRGKVTWISFTAAYLGYVRDADPTARLGYLVSFVTADAIATAQSLRSGGNEVFLDSSDYDADAIARCQTAGLPLEIWTINSQSIIESMDPYITGVTSDNLIAEEILREKAMTYDYGIAAVTVTAISATYTGGDVAAGTSVSGLTGLTVTATYSDGSASPVTGYTLSGSIAEGENTITVAYHGKTATFTVTGTAAESEDGAGWEDGKFYFPLVRGQMKQYVHMGYLDSGNTTRASYVGTACTVTPGASYRLVGVDGVRYGVNTILESGYANIQNNQNVTDEVDKLDSGWQNTGYEFVADAKAACIWLTSSFASGEITPEQAMPVYLEKIN